MSATQISDSVDVPIAGTWSVDPGHTEVGFVGRHLGLTKTRGRFTGVDGIVHVAADPTESTIDVTIEMASVESGSADRDDSLRSAGWFDVDNHPTARARQRPPARVQAHTARDRARAHPPVTRSPSGQCA